MAKSDKQTGDKAARKASEVLHDDRTSDQSDAAAGSALSQADDSSDKGTDERAASDAAKVLRSDDSSDKSKAAAGSALSQKQREDE